MKFEFKSRIRYSEVSEDNRIAYSNIVNYFQDCSTFQSELLGNTVEAMLARNRAWILAYWKIEFFRRPSLGEEVTIQTWPYSFRGFQGGRNYQMMGENGEVLARADSLWIYLDIESGHPTRVDQDVIAMYELEDSLPMEKTSRKVNVPEESVEMEAFRVRKSYLDTNHHVNNAQYITMAEEYLPEGIEVSQIRVEYKKSAKLGEKIVPLVAKTEEMITVVLCDEEKNSYAVVEFKI